MADGRAQRAALEALQAEVAELELADDTRALEEARAFLAALRAQAEAERDEARRALDVERARARGSLSRRGLHARASGGAVREALVVTLLCGGLATGVAAHRAHSLWSLAGALASMVAFGRHGWRQGQRDWALQHAEREQADG